MKNVAVKQNHTSQLNTRRQIYPLRSLKDAQLFRFHVPAEVITATWTFRSNITDGCRPVNVFVNLKWKGFPVVRIKNQTIPENFVKDDSEQYLVQFKSDFKLFTFNLTKPLPGEWFAFAYTDNVEKRIRQKGLSRQCQAYITSHLSFSKLPSHDDIVFLSPSVSVTQFIHKQKLFKFFASQETLSAKITVTKCSQSPKASNGIDCPIKIYFRKLSLPAENNFDKSYDCKQSYSRERACYIADLNISRRNWNYLLILIEDEAAENNASVEFELLLSSEECYNSNPNLLSSKSIYYARTAAPISTTTRFPYPSPTSRAKNELISREPFTSPLRSYGYGSQFNQKHSKTCPQHINLMRYNLPGFLEFKFDSPMTLNSSFSSFSPFIGIANGNYSLGNNSLPIVTLIYFEVISLIDSGGNLVIDLGLNPATNTTYHNVSVTLCLNYEYYSLTLEECLKTLTVNTTSEDEMLKSIVIPYPRAGMWFATVKTECLFIEQEKASRVQCEFNTTSILLNIKSSSCNEGKCGKYGDCYHKIDGALMFSTCVCKPELGRKGWWCEDDSEKLHEDQLMLNFLLLTLSNILFIPSVILASCRRHFTEALVYFTTMLSSALYHACDSQSTIAFCVLKLNILQFGDFYSALLCFWVTLISLAQLGDKLRTFLHMFGCIFIGFVVQYDRTSLWAFALPTGIGLIVLFIAWISHCIHRRARHVFGMIRLLFIFFGTSLAIGGLVLYAYFETEENYAITHSVWHGVMALALLPFILAIRTETPEEEEDFRGKGSNYETYYELIAEEASHLARHPLT